MPKHDTVAASESDWDTSADEEVVYPLPAAGSTVTVSYKGTKYSGTVVEPSSSIPSDIVPVTVKSLPASSEPRALWCRNNDGALAPLTRGECRKLVQEFIGKSAKTDTPSDADTAACCTVFGTCYPIQMRTETSTASGSASATPADNTVQFKVGKQAMVGTILSMEASSCPPGIIAAAVNGGSASSSSVYWLVDDANKKKVPMTVTDARKILKTVLGRPLEQDGPTDEDTADCIAACGVACPAQLYEAKIRNDRAKAKREKKQAAADNALTGQTQPTSVKRKAESDAEQPPAAKSRVVQSTADDTVSITFSGSAGALMPLLTYAMSSKGSKVAV